MNIKPNTVKIGSSERYHHGALRDALIRAAEQVLAERGVEGFSLRETARRAGVSPAAPQHHFGDARGLLTAVATIGFIGLGDALMAADARAEGGREARLGAQGIAYVAFALAQPSRFDLIWRRARLDTEDQDYIAAGSRAFGVLQSAIAGAPLGSHPAPPDTETDPRAIACWSLVHGFARLALDGAFGMDDGAAQRAADAMLPQILGRLRI